MKNPETAKPYEWDWDGEAILWKNKQPEISRKYTCSWGTFSVAVFQWIPTKDGKRLKRAKSIKRVRGYVNDPYVVFRMAQDLVNELNHKERTNA